MGNFKIEGFEMMVPTYNGKLLDDNPGLKEFDEPELPVFVGSAEGVRIVLGTHDYHDYTKPDVQIERRHNGWLIFLHPQGGSDASGYIAFLDDGRSYVVKECCGGPTTPIEMVEHEEAFAEIDETRATGMSCEPTSIIDASRIDGETEAKPPAPEPWPP